MTGGIFDSDIHAANMESAKIMTYGFLGISVTSGYKFLRSLDNFRHDNRERIDLKFLRGELGRLLDLYRRARNAIEYLDEAIAKGQAISSDSLSFSILNELRFEDGNGVGALDFSEAELEKLVKIWGKVILALETKAENSP